MCSTGQDGCITNKTAADFATPIKTSKYGKSCSNWRDHAPVLSRHFNISGNLTEGKLWHHNVTANKGTVTRGSCHKVFRKQHMNGTCTSKSRFHSGIITCLVGGNPPDDCVDSNPSCSATENCCQPVSLSCCSDYWVLTCGSDVTLYNASDSFAQKCAYKDKYSYCLSDIPSSAQCRPRQEDVSVCCDVPCCNSTECCALNNVTEQCCNSTETRTVTKDGYKCDILDATQRNEICYIATNMYGWYMDFVTGAIFDSAHQRKRELFVHCDLSLVEDVSIYPKSELLYFNKPILSKNYCRNPNNDSARGLWCYVDLRDDWQTCDLPLCPGIVE